MQSLPPTRLLLRLTTECNNGCVHCPLADVRPHQSGARTFEQAVRALSTGRAAGCREVVFLRGEATLLPHLPALVLRARQLGYTHVQLQSNGRRLALPAYVAGLVRAGLTHAELSLYGPTAEVHDTIAQVPGAFAQSCAGIRHALAAGLQVMVRVHVLAANAPLLAATVHLAANLGARRVQLDLMRPISQPHLSVPLWPAHPLSLSAPLADAEATARSLGVALTTEAMPDCAFAHPYARPLDAWSSTASSAMRIDDLHRVIPNVQPLREAYRASPAACTSCLRSEMCPRTWASVLDHFGEEAFSPIRGAFMQRIVEPELMDNNDQAEAYADADFTETDHRFLRRYLERFGSDACRVIDLGCGPGNIAFLFAEALPAANITGVDGSQAMLQIAEKRRSNHPANERMAFVLRTLPSAELPKGDVVVSNSLLHHIHQPEIFWSAIKDAGLPGAKIYVSDLRRPQSPELAQELVRQYAADSPQVLQADFFASLCAAFKPDEVREQLIAAGLPHFQVRPVGDRHLEIWGQLPANC